jgi:alpha-tubulin suppressor-like RCC1 family protein
MGQLALPTSYITNLIEITEHIPEPNKPTDIKTIVAGASHTIMVMNDNRVYGFGR